MPSRRHHPVPIFFTLVAIAALPAQRWVNDGPMPARGTAAMAFDAARNQFVQFGGNRASLLGNLYEPWQNFADTWVHDATGGATGWREVHPASAPPGIHKHTMVQAAGRQRVVLFGGQRADASWNDDTWEWNGTDWSLIATAHRPPTRDWPLGTYDPVRDRVVRHGGRITSQGPFQYGNDTWEYDGVDWTQVQAATSPPMDLFGGLAYMPSVNRCVLLGYVINSTWPPTAATWHFDGTNWTRQFPVGAPAGSGPLCRDAQGHLVTRLLSAVTNAPETWRYDGVAWTQVVTAHAPEHADLLALEFDSVRNRVVLSAQRELWEFDGLDWQLAAAAPGLPRTVSQAIAYDTLRQRVVMCTGWQQNGTNNQTNDHFEWDGVGWQRLAPSQAPSPRIAAAMVYDARRSRLVLHGGFTAGYQILTDTWEYDGATWRVVPTAHAPYLEGLAMAYDECRGRTVAFGVDTRPFTPIAATWEFDGVDWQSTSAAAGPSPRYTPALAFDSRRGLVVLHGGAWGSGRYVDTWEYDGVWHLRNPQVRPPAANAHAAFDPVRGSTVLVIGPDAPGNNGAFHEYTGSVWQPLAANERPPLMMPLRLVFDRGAQRLRMIGDFGEVWHYEPAPAAHWTRHGTRCGNGPTLDAVANSVPSLGSTFQLEVTGLAPQPGALWLAYGTDLAVFAGAPLPLELAALGLPGCALWLAPTHGDLVLHGGSTAQQALSIPNTAALAGVHFAAQALVIDAAAPQYLGGVSNAGIATVW